jgi:hypothetical protein
LPTTGNLSSRHPVVVDGGAGVGRGGLRLLRDRPPGTASRQLCAGFQQCRSFVGMCTVSCVLARAHEGG